MSTPDLWAESEYDWRRLVGLPTLPVAWPSRGRSVGAVVPDKERRDRLAFAIRAAMRGRTAEEVAAVIQPKRSKETIARWARGETVPSALDVGPLAAALGVRVELLVSPPALPDYPLAEYLVEQAAGSGIQEGIRRARQAPAPEARPAPSRSSARPPRAAGAGR